MKSWQPDSLAKNSISDAILISDFITCCNVEVILILNYECRIRIAFTFASLTDCQDFILKNSFVVSSVCVLKLVITSKFCRILTMEHIHQNFQTIWKEFFEGDPTRAD